MSVIEQTPQYTLNYVDDGINEKVQLAVNLPGVESAGELDVVVRRDTVSIHVPGRYKLEVRLDVAIAEKPEVLRFVKKKAQLKAVFVVDEDAVLAAAYQQAAVEATMASRRREEALRQVLARVGAVPGGSVAGRGPDGSTASTSGAAAAVKVVPPCAAAAAAHGGASGLGGGGGGGASGASNGSGDAAAAAAAAAAEAEARNGGAGGRGSGGGKAARAEAKVHDSFYDDLVLPGARVGKGRGGAGAAGGKAAPAPAPAAPHPPAGGAGAAAAAPTPAVNGGSSSAGRAASQAAAPPQQAQQRQRQTDAPSGAASAGSSNAGSSKGGPSGASSGPAPTSAAPAPAAASTPAPSATPVASGRAAAAAAPSAAPTPAPGPPRTEATRPGSSAAAGGGGTASGTNGAAAGGGGAASGTNGAATSGGANGGANGGTKEALYETAKQMANREAAAQWLERAASAARQGDLPRAQLLLGRAISLCPERAEQLTAEYNAVVDPEYRLPRDQHQHTAGNKQQQQQQQQPSAAGASGGAAGGKPGPAAGATGPGAGTKQGATGAGARQAGAGGAPGAGAGAGGGKGGKRGGGATHGSKGSHEGPAKGDGDKHHQQHQQHKHQQHQQHQQHQHQHGAQGAAGTGGSAGGAAQGSSGGGSGASSSFKPDPSARPPPRSRAAKGAEAEADASGVEQRWDWWFTGVMKTLKAWIEPRAGPGWYGASLNVLYLAVWVAISIPHIIITTLAALLVVLYRWSGYPSEAAGLSHYCQRSAAWMCGCACVTGLPLGLLLLWLLPWIVAATLALLGALFTPSYVMGVLQFTALLLAVDGAKMRLPKPLVPAPLVLASGGSLLWRAVAIGLYILTYYVAPSRVWCSAFAISAVLSCQALVWYKALPALLLEALIWLILAATSTSSGGEGGAGGGRAHGGARGAHGHGHGHGHAHEDEEHAEQPEQEVPHRGRLAPENVKGATGEIARVLAARDHFAVLGLSADDPAADPAALTDEAVRSAYRKVQLRVHPDKAGEQAGSEQASKRVNEAYRLLQTAEGRTKVLAEMRSPPPSASAGEAAAAAFAAAAASGRMPADVGMPLPCWRCTDIHVAKIHGTDCARARYCTECHTHHPAHDGDVWIWEDHTAWFPQRKMLLCLQGLVLDITEMAHCCGMFTDARGSRLPANTHYVQFRLDKEGGKGGKGGGGAGGADGFKGAGAKGRKKSKKR